MSAIPAIMQSPQPAAPTRGLYIDGLAVLKDPGSPGNRFGVDPSSILVVESGPGSASSIEFVIDDPGLAITIRRGDELRYHDIAHDRPIFLGRVQSRRVTVWGVGRRIAVKGIGVDAVLDWQIVPSLTIPAATFIGTAIQSIMANATGIGWPVIAARASNPGGVDGTTTLGLGTLSSFASGAKTSVDVVLAGTTVRAAIAACMAVLIQDGGTPDPIPGGRIYVDMGGMLRALTLNGSPSGHAVLSIADTVAGPIRAADPTLEEDFAGVPAGVYVTGGNAAGTGLVMRGDGEPGPIAKLNDSSILTAEVRDQVGAAYLAANVSALRATARLEDYDWSTNVRPCSDVAYTDAQLAISGTNSQIAAITKRYTPNGETWDLELGTRRPSVTRQLRRLTADVRP